MESSETNYSGHDWLAKLRERFVEGAARRVDGSDVEDVVQEALRIVVEKRAEVEEGIDAGSGTIDKLPPVAWCFQVLRNVIGNHYRREDVRKRRLQSQDDDGPAAATTVSLAETLDSRETLQLIEHALSEMRQSDPQCGRYISRLVEDARPQEVAEEEGLAPAVFYRRLYRCRQKLRQLLVARGVDL
jgi:RNA polymerase sigma factor (sigma-70 family)